MYEAAIEYGKMLRNTANIISNHKNIYKAAAALPYDMRAYFVMSRTAFGILYPNIQYEFGTVAQVIHEFVLSQEIERYILLNPDLDESKKFEFIVNGCEDFYSVMATIKEDIIALSIISNPKESGEGKVTWAVKRVTDRLESTPGNKLAWKFSINTLFPMKKTEEKNDTQTSIQPEEDTLNNNKTPKAGEEPILFEVKNDKQCVDVYHFLIDTKVLDERTSLPLFLNAIAQADMSSITPRAKTRFRSAIARLKWAIKGDANLWARIACKSIGHTPSSAAGNSSNSGTWFDDLCKLLPDNGNIK